MSPLLAIECSQRQGGVAFLGADGAVHCTLFDPDVRHGDALLPTIDSLLRSVGCTPGELGGCGVSLGPGGFTGLRVSIATCKSMGLALRIPIYGIPSALVVASSIAEERSKMIVALAGKREGAWLTGVECHDGCWTMCRPGALVSAGEEGDWFDEASVLVADEHLPESLHRFAVERGMEILPPSWNPEACLALTRTRHGAGDADQVHALQPIYPRVPEAVSIWQARKPG